MFPFQLLLALATDTLSVNFDAWVPMRMRQAHAAAVGIAVVTHDVGRTEWYHGVENVLTRRRVNGKTAWPIRAFSTASPDVASPHSRIGLVLRPGLTVLGVWTALAWVLLIPVSALLRQTWRLGRWHEVVAILLSLPLAWIFLRRLTGPVMATYFSAIAAAVLLTPATLAAIAWKRSRIIAAAIAIAFGLAAWSARTLAAPLPSSFDGGPPEGATLGQLRAAALRALEADSLQRIGMGFAPDGDRWIVHDRSRGAEALLVLIPARNLGVIVVSNSGETTELLEEIVDSIAR